MDERDIQGATVFRQSWDAFVGILETEAETAVGGGWQAGEPSGGESRMGRGRELRGGSHTKLGSALE